MNNFAIPVSLPGGRKEYFYELKIHDYKNILKFIKNNDFNGLSLYFEEMLLRLISNKDAYYTLNGFDKLIIIMFLRAVCVGSEIKCVKTAEGKNKTFTIKIFEKINELLSSNLLTDKIIKNNLYEITLSVPQNILLTDKSEIIKQCMRTIKVTDSEPVNLFELNTIDREQAFEYIPSLDFKIIQGFINETNKSCTDICLLNDVPGIIETKIELNFFNNSIMVYLFSIFSDDLANFYDNLYIGYTRLFLGSDVYDMTPAELLLYCNILKTELKQQQEQTENQNKGYNILSGPPPSPVEFS